MRGDTNYTRELLGIKARSYAYTVVRLFGLALFAFDRFGDYDEKDVVHSEILEEGPIYEDERDEDDWPTYV